MAEIIGWILAIVFFITLLSLIIQGMSIAKTARILHLDFPAEKEVEISRV